MSSSKTTEPVISMNDQVENDSHPPMQHQTLLDELVETVSVAFPDKLITSLIFFFFWPSKLFRCIHNRRFDILTKPVSFFLTCVAVSFTLIATGGDYLGPTWQEMYSQLKQPDKAIFNRVFTSVECEIDSMELFNTVLQSQLNFGDNVAEKSNIQLYLKANGYTDLAERTEAAYSRAARTETQQNVAIFLIMILIVIPWSYVFHWMLRSDIRTSTDTIHHALYFMGLFFLLCITSITFNNPYYSTKFYLFLFFAGVTFLLVQHIRRWIQVINATPSLFRVAL